MVQRSAFFHSETQVYLWPCPRGGGQAQASVSSSVMGRQIWRMDAALLDPHAQHKVRVARCRMPLVSASRVASASE
jgi:hypothetical protein